MSSSKTTKKRTQTPQSSVNKSGKKRAKAEEQWQKVLDGTAEYEDAFFHYLPNVLGADESNRLLLDLKQRHTFKRDTVVVFGRLCQIPRTQVLLSKQAGVTYRYAGCDMISEAWSDELDALCARFSQRFNVPLNSALVNRYANGSEKVGRHADDERDMEHDVIVTVSLGATRMLRITGKNDASDKKIQVLLQSGSVFVQKRGAQKLLKHEIPEELTVKEERVSITFRQLRLPVASIEKRAKPDVQQKKKAEKEKEEEPEEFYFDFEDKEFVTVCNLARDWCKLHKVGPISNSTDGEITAMRFGDYVEKEHSEVAHLVKKDGTVYEAVLMYLNDNDELKDDEEEGEL